MAYSGSWITTPFASVVILLLATPARKEPAAVPATTSRQMRRWRHPLPHQCRSPKNAVCSYCHFTPPACSRSKRDRSNYRVLVAVPGTSTGTHRRFEPQFDGGLFSPGVVAVGLASGHAATNRLQLGFRLRLVDKVFPAARNRQRPLAEPLAVGRLAAHATPQTAPSPCLRPRRRDSTAGRSAPRNASPGRNTRRSPPETTCSGLGIRVRSRPAADVLANCARA